MLGFFWCAGFGRASARIDDHNGLQVLDGWTLSVGSIAIFESVVSFTCADVIKIALG